MLVLIILKLTNIHQEFRPRGIREKMCNLPNNIQTRERSYGRTVRALQLLLFFFTCLTFIIVVVGRTQIFYRFSVWASRCTSEVEERCEGSKISREPYGQNIWFKASEVKARSAQGQYLSNFHIRFIVLFVIQCFMIELRTSMQYTVKPT